MITDEQLEKDIEQLGKNIEQMEKDMKREKLEREAKEVEARSYGEDFEILPEEMRKMFIGGLSPKTTDDDMCEYYSQWGNVIDSIVIEDNFTKRSRCFGFVIYAQMAEVDLAMANRPHVMDGKVVDPKRCAPNRFQNKPIVNISSPRLYVNGICGVHTDDTLRDYFSQYGNVVKAEVVFDKETNKRRGFAFITFDDYDPVDKCVLLKNHTIEGAECTVKKQLDTDGMLQARDNRSRRLIRQAHFRGMMRAAAKNNLTPATVTPANMFLPDPNVYGGTGYTGPPPGACVQNWGEPPITYGPGGPGGWNQFLPPLPPPPVWGPFLYPNVGGF